MTVVAKKKKGIIDIIKTFGIYKFQSCLILYAVTISQKKKVSRFLSFFFLWRRLLVKKKVPGPSSFRSFFFTSFFYSRKRNQFFSFTIFLFLSFSFSTLSSHQFFSSAILCFFPLFTFHFFPLSPMISSSHSS